MMQLFGRMRAKGVRIRVLTNSLASNDAPAAHAGYARYRKDLLALGVELYEMRAEQEGTVGGMGSTAGFGSGQAGGSKSGASRASLHSKAVIIDQRLAVIGSMNLDLRSQRQEQRSRRCSSAARPCRGKRHRRWRRRSPRAPTGSSSTPGSWCGARPPALRSRTPAREPEASTKLKLLVRLIAPFAPDEML